MVWKLSCADLAWADAYTFPELIARPWRSSVLSPSASSSTNHLPWASWVARSGFAAAGLRYAIEEMLGIGAPRDQSATTAARASAELRLRRLGERDSPKMSFIKFPSRPAASATVGAAFSGVLHCIRKATDVPMLVARPRRRSGVNNRTSVRLYTDWHRSATPRHSALRAQRVQHHLRCLCRARGAVRVPPHA